jgi:hypothetical protein
MWHFNLIAKVSILFCSFRRVVVIKHTHRKSIRFNVSRMPYDIMKQQKGPAVHFSIPPASCARFFDVERTFRNGNYTMYLGAAPTFLYFFLSRNENPSQNFPQSFFHGEKQQKVCQFVTLERRNRQNNSLFVSSQKSESRGVCVPLCFFRLNEGRTHFKLKHQHCSLQYQRERNFI